MKKLVLTAGGLVVANVIANMYVKSLPTAAGSVAGTAYLAAAHLVPVPITYKQLRESVAA